MIAAKSIRIGLVAGAVAIGGLLSVSGRASLGSLLFLGFFLLCPLMMLGMHGGSHQHGGNASVPEGQGVQSPTQPHVH